MKALSAWVRSALVCVSVQLVADRSAAAQPGPEPTDPFNLTVFGRPLPWGEAVGDRQIGLRTGTARLLFGQPLEVFIRSTNPEGNSPYVRLYLKVPNPLDTAKAIIAMRDTTEISAEQLHTLIGAPAASRVYQYLGVTTWFWKVTVKKAARVLDLVVARMPVAPDQKARFVIVERRYSRE